jgi:hypothetical protein
LLLCEALDLESTHEELSITAFAQLFQKRGLPQAIRSDNGGPFTSPNALFNLSKLSVWWLRLGHLDRTHQARPPAAKQPPRANAPDSEPGWPLEREAISL